nr:MarR family transcriptional regulator [uncultured Pseudogulbenkiania sp.]
MKHADNALDQPKTIKDLVSYRLHHLANLSVRDATLRYQRKFDISLLEWRAIAQLGGFAPLSLNDLAKHAGLQKSYASRTVAALIKRGWVASTRDKADGRGVKLSLTPEGLELYHKVFDDAVERNKRWLSVLTAEEQKQILVLFDKLTDGARQLLNEDRGAADVDEDSDTAPDFKASVTAAKPAAAKPEAASGEELEEMRALVTRLTHLLEKNGVPVS